MKVFMIGGGTGGPTAPLLAVAESLKKHNPDILFYYIGTSSRIDRKIFGSRVQSKMYFTIPAGKWRRYFSIRNIFDIFMTLFGFFKSWYLIREHKPDIIFGAGSYAQVPMAWAGWLEGVPFVGHQQDVKPLLSTKLVHPIATAITVSFDITARELVAHSGLFGSLKQSKVVVTGNPVRKSLSGGSVEIAKKVFHLNGDYPTVLVTGGGGGSKKINDVLRGALPELVKYVQIIHLTGDNDKNQKQCAQYEHYHAYTFLDEDMKHAYAIADLVIARAGVSTLSELSYLKKLAILVPITDSLQEFNMMAAAAAQAAIGVVEQQFTPDLLIRLVRKILWDYDLQKTMKNNIYKLLPCNADDNVANVIIQSQKQHGKK